MQKEIKINTGRLKKVADEKGYCLNSNESEMNRTITKMTDNYVKFGKYFCPCKQSRPLNAAKDAVCPCNELAEEVSDLGHCFCKIFFKGRK